jgi:hypothetical protein
METSTDCFDWVEHFNFSRYGINRHGLQAKC